MCDLVQQARAALEGVTPGPWRHIPNGAKTSITDEDYDRLFIASGTCAPFYDARFIAASRDLVPAMADEIERLRAENDRLRAALQSLASEVDSTFMAFTVETIEAWGKSNFDDVQESLTFSLHVLKADQP